MRRIHSDALSNNEKLSPIMIESKRPSPDPYAVSKNAVLKDVGSSVIAERIREGAGNRNGGRIPERDKNSANAKMITSGIRGYKNGFTFMILKPENSLYFDYQVLNFAEFVKFAFSMSKYFQFKEYLSKFEQTFKPILWKNYYLFANWGHI